MEREFPKLIWFGATLICFLFYGSCALDQASEGAKFMPLSENRSSLPQGNNGIAARYPGDEGIENDPAVVFHDDFESGDLSKWIPGWRSENARITEETVHTGSRAMQWAVKTASGDDGGNIGVKLGPGLDVCFFRVYCRLPENFYVRKMHGWSITARPAARNTPKRQFSNTVSSGAP